MLGGDGRFLLYALGVGRHGVVGVVVVGGGGIGHRKVLAQETAQETLWEIEIRCPIAVLGSILLTHATALAALAVRLSVTIHDIAVALFIQSRPRRAISTRDIAKIFGLRPASLVRMHKVAQGNKGNCSLGYNSPQIEQNKIGGGLFF